jgi:methionyl-tRNA synthetase
MTTIAPWSKEPHVAQASFITSVETLRVCGICLQPFVPSVAGQLLDALGVPIDKRAWEFATLMLVDGIDEKGRVWNITPNVKLFDSLERGENRLNSDKSKG